MRVSDAQQRAIEAAAPALQIVACAGSGKTEVLARRAVRYLTSGMPASAIVAFTFTEKAAAELKERIELRAAEADPRFTELPPCSAGLFVGTIHSFCLRILHEHGGAYELREPLSDEREWALLHRFARRLGVVELFKAHWPGEPATVRRAVEAFRASLAVLYNERLDREEVARKTPGLVDVAARYEHLLERMHLISFDQMIDAVCSELKRGGPLREALSGRVRVVLVDEYQDLNRAQEELLEHLVQLGAELTVVGDDDQAVYQWRGGDVSLFLGFPSRFRGTLRLELGENRRSLPGIVTLASRFAETIGSRCPKLMTPTRTGSDPSVDLMVAETAEHEAALVAQRIKKLLSCGIRPSEIAILFRSVRTSARPVIDALRQSRIPAALVGRVSLLDRPEMALLARIFVWWAGGEWWPGEEREVITTARLARDLMDLTGVSDAQADKIVIELDRLGRRLTEEGVRDLVGTYLEVLNLTGLPVSGPERERQERGLGRLSELLVDFEHAQRRSAPRDWMQMESSSCQEEVAEDNVIHSLTVGDVMTGGWGLCEPPGRLYLRRLRVFLEQFASLAAEEVPETPSLASDAVNIMTVHQSKGLEFPVVFVPCLVERRFPPASMGRERPWMVPSDMFERQRYQGREQDERRVFYVALTRARDLLCLSCFKRHRRGSASISRFLADVLRIGSQDLIAKGGACQPLRTMVLNAPERPVADLAFTEVLTYAECPRKYYLRHVCRFQPPIAPELGFGRILHHAVAELARSVRMGRIPSEQMAEEILDRRFYLPFASPEARQRMYDAAKRRLRRFAQQYGHELLRTIEVERRVEMPIGMARLRGRIDLILRARQGGPNHVEVVDFKTSATKPPHGMYENQLRLYADSLRRLGFKPLQLIIYDLDAETGGPVPVPENPEEREQFRTKAETWVDGICKGHFDKNTGDWCRSCDFRTLCA